MNDKETPPPNDPLNLGGVARALSLQLGVECVVLIALEHGKGLMFSLNAPADRGYEEEVPRALRFIAEDFERQAREAQPDPSQVN